MTASDVICVCGAFLAAMAICSLPMLGSLQGAGPRQRATLTRQLGVGWLVMALAAGWVVLGALALDAGGQWFGPYRDATLVLMGAFFPMLVTGIRAGNRAATVARQADEAAA